MTTRVRFYLSYDALKCDFVAFKMNIISIRKRFVDTDVINDVTSSRQSVITRVVIRFLWHDVIHCITTTSCDKSYHSKYYYVCKFSTFFFSSFDYTFFLYTIMSQIIIQYWFYCEKKSSWPEKNYMTRTSFIPGKSFQANTRLTSIIFTCLSCVVFGTWLRIILLCSVDVHPNPGPSSTPSSVSVSCLWNYMYLVLSVLAPRL